MFCAHGLSVLSHSMSGLSPRGSSPTARALHILITQGAVLRNDFKVYMGLGERTAITQLKQLVQLGVVDSPSPKSRLIHPGFPAWFAQLIFPDLHRRFI